MPLDNPWYSANWRRRPPGMIFDDWIAWEQWITSKKAEDYQYAYNVLLPFVAAPENITDEALKRQWVHANARRIDAVGRINDEYTIFEARRRTGWSAIAQLLGYSKLWPLIYPDLDLCPDLILVTTEIPDEIHAIARILGITVIIQNTSPPAPA